MPSRDIAIDTLRGIAIIAMVAGHVVMGMNVPVDSFWISGYHLFEDIRMPLFTALSGFVYGLRPLGSASGYGKLVRGKARRLLVPLVVVGTTFTLVQSLTPGTNEPYPLESFWHVYVYGVFHFWFLQSLFIVFLLVALCDAFGVFDRPWRLLVAILVTAPLTLLVDIPDAWNFFAANGAIRILPFFLLGYALNRYGTRLASSPRWILAAAVALFVVKGAGALGIVELPAGIAGMVGISLGLCAITSLIVYRRVLAIAPLARLGTYSFGIYLLHVFGTAPARMLLHRLGLENETVVFAASLVCGLALPVLFELVFGRIGWISWAVLGQRARRAKGRVAAAV